MTTDELEAMRAKTKRATEIISTLDSLSKADPYRAGNYCRIRDKSSSDILSETLTLKVVAEGLLKVVADLEAELAAL